MISKVDTTNLSKYRDVFSLPNDPLTTTPYHTYKTDTDYKNLSNLFSIQNYLYHFCKCNRSRDNGVQSPRHHFFTFWVKHNISFAAKSKLL
uniref:Uncharacterized protein n=1 Tax=Romanomermis culicivorax TaxID=13658 RepID=A0A915HPN7_ROMCU